MTGYYAVLLQGNDVADRQAVSLEIRRMIHIEPLINHIQIGSGIPIIHKPAGVDRVVAAALRRDALALQVVIVHEAVSVQFTAAPDLIDEESVLRVFQKQLFRVCLFAQRHNAAHRVPFLALHAEHAGVGGNVLGVQRHGLGVVAVEQEHGNVLHEQLHGALLCQRQHGIAVRVAVLIHFQKADGCIRHGIALLQLRQGRQLGHFFVHFRLSLRLRFFLCPPFPAEQDVEAFQKPMGAVVDADLVCQLDEILQLLPQLCVLTGKQPVRHRLRRWSVRAVGNVQPPAQERRVVGGKGQRVGAGGRDGDKLIFRVLGKLDAALLANLREMLFHVGDDAVCGLADGVQTGAELRQLGVF